MTRQPMCLMVCGILLLALVGCDRLPIGSDTDVPTPLATLARANPTPDVAALADQLEGSEWAPRLAAGRALVDRDDVPVEERVDLLLQGLAREIESPAASPAPANVYLSASAVTRIHLTRALSELGPDAIKPLRERLETASGEVREHALIALGYAGEASVGAEVRDLVTGAASPEVRMDAARALGALGDKDAVPHLEAALRDSFSATGEDHLGTYTLYPVREQAAAALRALGVPVTRGAEGVFEIGEP